MPDFSIYEPEAQSKKSILKYSYMGRSTIFYSTRCGKPISDAISVLNTMKESQSTSVNNETNIVVWVEAIVFFCFLFVYQIINIVIMCKSSCR